MLGSEMKSLLICLLWNAALIRGFYVPGVGPRDFMTGESVDIKVDLFPKLLILKTNAYFSILYDKVGTIG